MKAEHIAQQIRDVTSLLIRESLVDSQNGPSLIHFGKRISVGILGAPTLSDAMRDVSYEDAYISTLKAGAFNLRMIDGALIQLLYTFSRRSVLSHRLLYLPSPALASYDEAAELYRDDEVFADIFSGSIVRAPIRCDFDSSATNHVDVIHPMSHMTIGQYKGCRIPVNGPFTPQRFMRFILRNFYNPAYSLVDLDKKALASTFDPTITIAEKAILHINA